ncbi:glycosyltransferase family 4 protein [Dyella soli]|uniref:Glycosyltransferase family 1 protein n=1 Tax=Dyella soli TaxID=522319 RepID=A0A4R0YZW7_9GAMM|nr:glycosyltransferase family 4 protein [Dyella soli]TCI11134.1 glycosyltransferase family 1 protein [Dyella soli]
MNPIGLHRTNSFALLNLLTWVRRQAWLSRALSIVPSAWRRRVSAGLKTSAYKGTAFLRSDRWVIQQASGAEVHRFAPARVSKAWHGGVTVHAFAKGQFGLGENARLHTRALMSVGYPVALRDIALGVPHSQNDDSLDAYIGSSAPYPVDLVFANPDHFSEIMQGIRRSIGGDRYVIGCWFWELEKFPEAWLQALDDVDEVMVASDFVEQAVRSATHKPVFKVPVPLGDVNDSGLERADFGLDPDATIFLCTFDFHSSLARKNPLGTVEAFQRAFPDRCEKVCLLLKSSNGHSYPERFRELMASIKGDSRIIVRDDIIDRQHLHALQRCCDAYVSLHRSEGFGLGLAESMRLGKPVIGTRYSGNLEFMTDDNSYLVNFRMAPVPPGAYIHPENQYWAEPDLDHAAALMRSVVAAPAEAKAKGSKAAEDVRRQLSVEACVTAMTARLDNIYRRRPGAPFTTSGNS